VMSYCDYDADSGESDAFCPLSMNLMCSKITPSTKEQRDTLFTKMKEAGYVWNAEKKELKKTEEEFNGEDYGVDSLWHARNILERTFGKVEGYQTDDGILEHKCAISAVKQLAKQNNAWSEEDDQYLLVCKNALAKYQASDKWDAAIISHWLENKLKAPQNTWKPSDEQIIELRRVISGCSYDIEPLAEMEEQLKKLSEK